MFFAELGLPAPDRQLGIALGSNSSQTARMLAALEPVVAEEAPDAVLVYGDTNSTLAGALAGAQAGVPVAHVEAGMRSFDRSMPEELNRVLTDHASSLLLCSSEVSVENLRREGVSGTVELVGDVMVDVALEMQPLARERDRSGRRARRGAGRVRARDRAPSRATSTIRSGSRCWWSCSARCRCRSCSRCIRGRATAWRRPGCSSGSQDADNVVLTPPLGYVELTALLCNARAVLTDSGGLQKEAYLAGVPCITLRADTEWTETVEHGWNTLVDLDAGAALAALEREPPPSARRCTATAAPVSASSSALTLLVR